MSKKQYYNRQHTSNIMRWRKRHMAHKKRLIKKEWLLIAAFTSSAGIFAAQEANDYLVTVDKAVRALHWEMQHLSTELNDDEYCFEQLKNRLHNGLSMDLAHNAVVSSYNPEDGAALIPFDYAVKKFNRMQQKLKRKTIDLISAQHIQGFTVSPSGEIIVSQFDVPAKGWYEDCGSAMILSYSMQEPERNNLVCYGTVDPEAGDASLLHEDGAEEITRAVYRHHLVHSSTDNRFAFIRTQASGDRYLNHLIVFDPQTGARGAENLGLIEGEVLSLAFSKEGDYIIGNVQDANGTISYPVWHIASKTIVENPNDDALLFFPSQEITQNRSLIAYSDDSDVMAVATLSLNNQSNSSTISLLEHGPNPDHEPILSFDIEGIVKAITFSKNKKRIAVTSTIVPNRYEIIEVWRIDNPEHAYLEKRIESQSIGHALFSYDRERKKESVIYKARSNGKDHIIKEIV